MRIINHANYFYIFIISLFSAQVAAWLQPYAPIANLWASRLSRLSSESPVPGMSPNGKADAQASAGIMISDVIGRAQDVAIFSGLTRDIDTVSQRLEDPTKNVTVLAPDNNAMKALPRKPWEDPLEYAKLGAQAYAGQEGESRAQANMRRFVEAHIVPESPWQEQQKVQTLAGNTVWYESKDGRLFVQPGNVEVLSVAEKVSNGQVWVLGGVVKSD